MKNATTYIFGRTWTTLFSEQIQIVDGTYKFRDLPGLMFLLSDSITLKEFKVGFSRDQTVMERFINKTTRLIYLN